MIDRYLNCYQFSHDFINPLLDLITWHLQSILREKFECQSWMEELPNFNNCMCEKPCKLDTEISQIKNVKMHIKMCSTTNVSWYSWSYENHLGPILGITNPKKNVRKYSSAGKSNFPLYLNPRSMQNSISKAKVKGIQ